MCYRLPAEWEKQDAIQFTFPHADSDWKLILEDAIQVFVDVITSILPFEKVIVVTKDITNTKSYFKDYSSPNLFFLTWIAMIPGQEITVALLFLMVWILKY